MSIDRYIGMKEPCQFFGVCRMTIYRWSNPALPDPMPSRRVFGGRVLWSLSEITTWAERQPRRT
jgi:predicted DNA-binding transcriptional regulator AlpA